MGMYGRKWRAEEQPGGQFATFLILKFIAPENYTILFFYRTFQNYTEKKIFENFRNEIKSFAFKKLANLFNTGIKRNINKKF